VLPNFFKVLIEYLETPGSLQPTIFGPFIEQTTTTTFLLPHLEMDNDLETARCSGCKRNNLPMSNFPWRRPGVRYKTCNRCRTPLNTRDRDQEDQEATAGNQIAQRRVEQDQETIAAGQTMRQADQGVEEQEEVEEETARCSSCRRDNLPMSNFDMRPGRPGVRYKTCKRCRTTSNVQLGDQEDEGGTARCSGCKRNDLPMSNFAWRRRRSKIQDVQPVQSR
jgi:ribosomal protein S12